MNYMLAFLSQMKRFCKEATENLEASKEIMKHWHNHKATLTEFQRGQKVWVMKSVESWALQDQWAGPMR